MVSIATEELKYERGHLPPLLATILVLNEVWALGTYEYFKAFPVSVLQKTCLIVSKCFHVCAHKSFAYYQLHRNKSKFLDYISESFLRKGISWIVGDVTVSCLHDTRVHFNEFVWVFNLRVTPNACVKRHLEPTHLKSSPLFTFSTKSLGQDSPSVHLFSKTIGSRFTPAKIKLGEDSPSWFIYFR